MPLKTVEGTAYALCAEGELQALINQAKAWFAAEDTNFAPTAAGNDPRALGIGIRYNLWVIDRDLLVVDKSVRSGAQHRAGSGHGCDTDQACAARRQRPRAQGHHPAPGAAADARALRRQGHRPVQPGASPKRCQNHDLRLIATRPRRCRTGWRW